MKSTLTYAIILAAFAFVVGHFVLSDVQASLVRLSPAANELVEIVASEREKELGRPLTDKEQKEVQAARVLMTGATETARTAGSLICRVGLPVVTFLLTLLIGGIIVFFNKKPKNGPSQV